MAYRLVPSANNASRVLYTTARPGRLKLLHAIIHHRKPRVGRLYIDLFSPQTLRRLHSASRTPSGDGRDQAAVNNAASIV